MPCRIAGIDVHKKVLAIVVSDVEIESEFQFERRMFGSNPEQLRALATWLLEQGAECGEHWNGIGSRSARSAKAQGGSLERCIWRRRYPIADGADARRISEMLNG